MKDKELVIRLADCYFWINKVHDLITEEYWAEKKRIRHLKTLSKPE